MQFVILYRNKPDARQFIEQWVNEATQKGINFSQQPVRTPFFETRPNWPSLPELFSFPTWLQCEEVKLQDNKLISVRAQVIDVEFIVTSVPVNTTE